MMGGTLGLCDGSGVRNSPSRATTGTGSVSGSGSGSGSYSGY
jgi:hypothetical protein